MGREYRIEIADTANGAVEFARRFTVPPAQRRQVLRDWYVDQAKDTILPRAQQHAQELGVELKSARIVDNRYRWGSCTVGDSVTFNWRLIKAPMFVIEYVIVHELAHLLEPNHTDAFWASCAPAHLQWKRREPGSRSTARCSKKNSRDLLVRLSSDERPRAFVVPVRARPGFVANGYEA